jgi:hypothetical protein
VSEGTTWNKKRKESQPTCACGEDRIISNVAFRFQSLVLFCTVARSVQISNTGQCEENALKFMKILLIDGPFPNKISEK